MENQNYVDNFLCPREEHYQNFFGSLTQEIMHSSDAKEVHIDIYQFEPTPDRPFWTLITSGMSNQIQPELEDSHSSRRTEILMYAEEPQGWMFSVMKGLAEMPFEDNTNLHWGHTVPNGMPMTAQPSLLTSFFFMPPFFEPLEFNELKLEDDTVDFLWMIPITETERMYAIEHGSDQLYEKIEDADMPIVVDENRDSVI
ncbi:MAG: suppressor of fused domain protein [Abditibacteriaceae bacterium]